ncbi:MAG: hypothetical protein ACI8O8_001481 [Oleiphilaceae bacterium]|jgi:hypothetical protein
MTNITFITAATINSEVQTTSTEIHSKDSNVVNIRSAEKAQIHAKQELMDYMMWTMKHDMDPHRLYDDPIEKFRSELKSTLSVA